MHLSKESGENLKFTYLNQALSSNKLIEDLFDEYQKFTQLHKIDDEESMFHVADNL